MYSLTTEEPSDWSETYSTYYTLSGNTYTRVPKGQSVPTWTANTYYKINWKLKSFYDKVYSKFDLTTSEPSDWSDNYKEYYILSNEVYSHVTGATAPTWIANTYYKLNSRYEDALDGNVIVAKTITAEKVNVTDLVAFDATIGGFIIDGGSIHSTLKESISSDANGLYMDNDGQFYFGDQNNHVKFFKVYEDDPDDPNHKIYHYELNIKSTELDEYMNKTDNAISDINDNSISTLQSSVGTNTEEIHAMNELILNPGGITDRLSSVESIAGTNETNISELQIKADGIDYRLKQKGGNNIFKYSLDFWDDGNYGIPNLSTDISSNLESDLLNNSKSQRGYIAKNGTSRQNAKVDDDVYTVSFLYKKVNSSATCNAYVNNNPIALDVYNEWTKITKTITADNIVTLSFVVDTDDCLLITDVMCNYGEEAQAWSQNPEEIYTEDIKIGKGIHVENNTAGTYTDINANGNIIRDSETNNIISKITKQGTETKYLTVNDGAEIAGLSVQVVNNQIWLSSLL